MGRPKIDRTGERRMMNCGMGATIIEYKNCENITVKFTDGTIVCDKSYADFKNCVIQNQQPRASRALSRVGERYIMSCGMEAEIIEYNGTNDITVRFDDGTIVQHKNYYAFQKGYVANPNYKTVKSSVDEIALRYYLAPHGYAKAPCGSLKEYGLKRFEIDVFNKDKGIGIEYDGYLHRHNLTRDLLKNDLFFKAFKKLIRIRDYRLPCNDKRVEYYKINTRRALSKEYETTLKNLFHNLGLLIDVNFQRDKDKIYDLYHQKAPQTRLGEKRIMRNGLLAEIINYRSSDDIDVQFDDGSITNTTYFHFVRETVGHPNYRCHAPNRLGMRCLMNCGMYAEIIQYNNSLDITVRFDDGAISAHKSYGCFIRGTIAYPNKSYKSSSQRKPTEMTVQPNRTGERQMMNCGLWAEIIKYNNSHDITVQFDDGTIVEHKLYRSFQYGAIGHPNILHQSYAKRKAPDKTKHIGERRIMNCGEEAEIIEYNNNNDITVRFMDSAIVSHKKYCHFCHGGIAHPNIDPHSYTKRKTATATVQSQI